MTFSRPHHSTLLLLACALTLGGGCASGSGSGKSEDRPNTATTKGLSPIPADAPIVGDTLATQWFGIGATGPVYVHVYFPANPIITLWAGQLKAGDKIRVGRRKPVIVEYSQGSNLYFSLGSEVATATKERLGRDPIP